MKTLYIIITILAILLTGLAPEVDALQQAKIYYKDVIQEDGFIDGIELQGRFEDVAANIVPPNPNVLALMLTFSNYDNLSSYNASLDKVVATDIYFQQVSYGDFNINIIDLGSWLVLPNTREYYGGDSGGQIDNNFIDFVLDSLALADPFIDYTTIDYVFLIHAGNDQAASGDPNDLWSKASIGKWFFPLDGGVYLGWSIVAETDPYGVFAHELGHNLGLKDLYDSNGIYQYVGVWSLMDYGSWLNPPTGLMGPEKSVLDWLDPIQVVTVNKDSFGTYVITPLDQYGFNNMIRIPVSSYYYSVEYRRRVGTDSSLPGSGIIISWVDYTIPSGSGPIRVVDKNPSTPTKNDAFFVAGDLYINLVDDFYIKVLEVAQGYARVFVQNGIPNLKPINLTYTSRNGLYNFSVDILNSGGPNPTSFDVSLYVNGSLINVSTVSASIPRNGVLTLEFNNIYLGLGGYTVTVEVDSGNTIVETNEYDNTDVVFIPPQFTYILDSYQVYPSNRVDVGSVARVMMYFVSSDGVTPYVNSPVILNGTTYLTNSSGWVALNISWNTVGKVSIYVTDGNATQNVIPQVIFDYVEITLTVVRERVSVGMNGTIQITARYAYDSTPFQGVVKLNDSLNKMEVGRFYYTVKSIVDNKYGLSAFSSNVVSIIFDRIVINISVDDRVDVGSLNPVNVSAYYEYDGTPFNGSIVFNDSFGKMDVGRYGYRVIDVIDNLYGIQSFISNPSEFAIIYDIVVIRMYPVDDRVDVGSEAVIEIDAYYAYDGIPFDGNIVLNDSLRKDVVGLYVYSVLEIDDFKFGLTRFDSSVVEIIFDRVVITLDALDKWINIGSNASILVDAYYEYDGKRFNGSIYLNQSTIQHIPGKYVYGVSAIDDKLYGLSVFSYTPTTIVFDAVEIIFFVADDRVDVGSKAEISFIARYAYSKELYPGRLILNDSLVKDDVGLYWYGVILVKPDPYNITALYYEPVAVIFDRVVIELYPVSSRVDVGGMANISWNAYYEYDGEPFQGSISLNDSLVKDVVGKYVYTVNEISDEKYGLTVFVSNSVEVIFDRVVILLSVERERVDVGSGVNLSIKAYYEYDGEVFTGEVVLSDPLSIDDVGLVVYRVVEIEDDKYGLTVFTSNSVEVIFDTVLITISVEDKRIDVGSTASITFNAYYAYDGSRFVGKIFLNDSLTKNNVGRYFYTVERIVDDLYGLSSFESNVVEVVFDRVVVELTALDDRVDVGSKVNINITAYYEFDGSPFNGSIELNDSLIKEDIGLYFYTVLKIDDSKFGLTVYRANVVKVIFDRVVIKLTAVKSNVPIGLNASIEVEAYYEFDGSRFEGEIYLNDSLYKDEPGRYYYTVSRIFDSKFELTSFTSNVVEVVFEKPILKILVDYSSPFKVVVNLSLHLEESGYPVNGIFKWNKEVIVDDDGDGLVSISISTLIPILDLDVEAYVGNYRVEEVDLDYIDPIYNLTGFELNDAFKGLMGESSFIHPLQFILYLLVILLSLISLILWRKGVFKK